MDRDTVEEIKRHFGIVAEELQSRIGGIAEGQLAVAAEIRRLRSDFDSFRESVTREFDQTRGVMHLSRREIEARVGLLESEVADIRGRLDRVESARDRGSA